MKQTTKGKPEVWVVGGVVRRLTVVVAHSRSASKNKPCWGILGAILLALLTSLDDCADWPQFRGPQASGLDESAAPVPCALRRSSPVTIAGFVNRRLQESHRFPKVSPDPATRRTRLTAGSSAGARGVFTEDFSFPSGCRRVRGAMQNVTRRDFLRNTLITAVCLPTMLPARAMEPIVRAGGARMRLSLAAYSFRQFFKTGAPPPAAATADRSIDLFQFIDYCAEQNCDATELTSYYFPADVDDDYLLRIRRHAFLRGIEISGTAIGNTFTWPPGEKQDQELARAKQWIDRAALMGAPHIRIFAGQRQDNQPLEEAKSLCIETIQTCCEYAAGKGIFFGLENHGGIVAEPDDLLDIVRAVKSPWFGINLDTGNFHTVDPYADLARCAPYAVNVQVKVEIQRRGKQKEPADLDRVIGILRESGYQGYVALEYESAEDPWVAVPPALRQLKTLMAG